MARVGSGRQAFLMLRCSDERGAAGGDWGFGDSIACVIDESVPGGRRRCRRVQSVGDALDLRRRSHYGKFGGDLDSQICFWYPKTTATRPLTRSGRGFRPPNDDPTMTSPLAERGCSSSAPARAPRGVGRWRKSALGPGQQGEERRGDEDDQRPHGPPEDERARAAMQADENPSDHR